MTIRKKTTDCLWLFASAWFCIAPMCGSSTAAVVVRNLKGQEKTVPTILVSDMECAGVSALSKALGLAVREDTLSKKLTCSKHGHSLVFSEDIPFVSGNDTIRQIPCAPVCRDGALFLPVWVCASVFGEMGRETVSWNPDDSVFVIKAATVEHTVMIPKPSSSAQVKQPDSGGEAETSTTQQIIKTIVIDPGHGGKDPGAIGPDGTEEKTIVLSVALQLRDALKKKSA